MIIYIIGIKGSGVGALAKILAEQGHIIRGVDVEEEFYTISHNLPLRIENFSNMQLKRCYLYIIGNAFLNHSVTNYIKKMGYVSMTYPEALNYFFENYDWLCVAGTSGKTTTTKMLSTLFPTATCLIGDGSYHLGTSNLFILEACEYRNTFLNYHPKLSLILNVNYDHIDFFKTQEDYEEAFLRFISQSKLCVVNGDECSYRGPSILTYGMQKNNDIVFEYHQGKVTILRKIFELPVLGIQYAYDFVGAYCMAKLYDIKDNKIQFYMNNFQMPKRRFEKKELLNQTIILDYAHHPKELETIYNALLEQYKNKKKICIFEPHTITRLQYFIKEYKRVLGCFDKCYLYRLFSSARETHNLTLEKELYKELGFKVYDHSVKLSLFQEKDCILCFLGAGVIDKACKEYIKEKQI